MTQPPVGSDVSTDTEAPSSLRKINYSGYIPREALFCRILGPDLFGALYYVWHTNYTPQENVTHAFVRSLPPGRHPLYYDEYGQAWIHHSALDSEGYIKA